MPTFSYRSRNSKKTRIVSSVTGESSMSIRTKIPCFFAAAMMRANRVRQWAGSSFRPSAESLTEMLLSRPRAAIASSARS